MAKITIARDVLTSHINDLPQDLNVGLLAYGHRRKGDCKDVKELVPLGELNQDRLIAKVKELNPKGKTPFTFFSVWAAFAVLTRVSLVKADDFVLRQKGRTLAETNLTSWKN